MEEGGGEEGVEAAVESRDPTSRMSAKVQKRTARMVETKERWVHSARRGALYHWHGVVFARLEV